LFMLPGSHLVAGMKCFTMILIWGIQFHQYSKIIFRGEFHIIGKSF